MLVVGAKGFAKEILEEIRSLYPNDDLVFYDDVSKNIPDELYASYKILNTREQAKEYFSTTDKKFVLGIGNPLLRRKVTQQFIDLGGVLIPLISNKSCVAKHDVQIGEGSTIMSFSVISNGSKIGKGCLLYFHSSITHDCVLGDFVEISPGAQILGRATVGDFSQVGSNAVILPGIKVGKNVIVGAGAVVTKDVPDNSVVVGVPAKIIKTNPVVE
jgi:sugar O-acyltransferase (sialic acid O-acetyltransferase NeuD family)